MFNKPNVQQTLCSRNPIFNKPYVLFTVFNNSYGQQDLCSTNPMFNKNSVFEQTVLRLVFLLSATKRSGEHPRTPVGLVAWALYGRFRSRAFHEVWCPKVIGRDSWVREATGVGVQSPPPKNWGKKLVVVRKRIARENGKSP